MILLCAEKNQLRVRRREPLTSGSVNVCAARFAFSEEWDGLERTAVFAAGPVRAEVSLGMSAECAIPREVLAYHGVRLRAGVCGKRGEEIVLPTVWADLGMILEGVGSGEGGGEGPPPTPDAWRQALERKGDGLNYTMDGELGLFSGERLLSSVPIPGGGEGGVSDHRLLAGRDAAEQHPVEAISGLKKELARIPAPVEPLTNEELEEILK